MTCSRLCGAREGRYLNWTRWLGSSGRDPARPDASPDASKAGGGSIDPSLPRPNPLPATAGSPPAATSRVVLGVGEPEPPILGRPDGLGGSVMEPKRIAPRSPRAA